MNQACEDKVTVIRGATLEYTISLTDESTKLPYDLTGATEIKACHPGENSAPVEALLSASEITVLNATLGQLRVKIDPTKTNLLAVGEDQTIELQITEADTDVVVTQFIEKLTVSASIC